MISIRIHDQGHYKQWIRGAPSLIPEPYPLPSEMEVKDKGEVGDRAEEDSTFHSGKERV